MSPAKKTQEMKVYISADMEGVAGVVNEEQLRPQGFEFQQFRSFMTAEVNAAIEGAREEGATEIVVSDSHGTGLNLLMDELPQDIQLVRSCPRRHDLSLRKRRGKVCSAGRNCSRSTSRVR